MKFNAALVAVVAAAATAHGAAVDADDFSDLDAFVANVPTDALRAAQSSIAAGVQPTPDATTAVTPAETSQVAAVANADDGLPSEEDIDKLIASADAKFGAPGDNKGLPAPPAADAAPAAQATPRDADQPSPEAIEAIKGVVAFAKAAAAIGTAPGIGSATATGGAATATGLVVDNSGNGTATPSQVWTAAAPRQAVGGLAVAGMIAAYFL